MTREQALMMAREAMRQEQAAVAHALDSLAALFQDRPSYTRDDILQVIDLVRSVYQSGL